MNKLWYYFSNFNQVSLVNLFGKFTRYSCEVFINTITNKIHPCFVSTIYNLFNKPNKIHA